MNTDFISEQYNNLIATCRALAERMHRPVIVIDGRAASGKSTMAQLVADEISASIVHADDFFLPYSMRSAERLADPGGNFHYERFYEEVLQKLDSSKDFSYGVFNCTKGSVDSQRTVKGSSPIIIEGAYSASPRFGKYYDLLIFVTASAETRLKRLEERNGTDKARMFKERWIPFEEVYIAFYGVDTSADIVIDTTNVQEVSNIQ